MQAISNNVRLQPIRPFTVQILNADKIIVGTGFVVDRQRKLVTCAHVIKQALGKHPRDCPPGQIINIYYPHIRDDDKKSRTAIIAAYFENQIDDVVLLELTEGQHPPEITPAVLGKSDQSEGNPFRAYGFPKLGRKESSTATGTILGPVISEYDHLLHAQLDELESQNVRPGMSGAAVLDVQRNLVVGLITSRWETEQPHETENVAWSTNAYVLSLDPLLLTLQDEDQPRSPGQTLNLPDLDEIRKLATPATPIQWNQAPNPLPEWVGRASLLEEISVDFINPNTLVTGLIGYGGEGKSSLARRWVDHILASDQPPDGVFWWGFYEDANTDSFMEAAFKYMTPDIDLSQVPGASRKAQMIAAMLARGKYVFVLDGFEVMQSEEGDKFGELPSNDLRDFLQLFATPGNPPHNSFCLITSRAPMSDLMEFETYQQRDVSALSPSEGRDLLRKVGVTGPDAALEKVVRQWDGHALTLSLIGAYLKDAHGGDINYIDDIPPPTADEDRYARVHRILKRYDTHLSDEERAFLTLFSVFRLPVREDAFGTMFRTASEHLSLNAPLVAMTDAAFSNMLDRLIAYRMLRRIDDTYTTHPLIRAHYFDVLTARADAKEIHSEAKDYYLRDAPSDMPEFPTMDDLLPLIEVVYHACRAGAYDEAWEIYWNRTYQKERRVISHQLGAHETDLAIMREFFPNGDLSQDPAVSDPGNQRFIVNAVGMRLMNLGRLNEAISFIGRVANANANAQDWHNASVTYRNLTEIHTALGDLSAAADAARESLRLAEKAQNKGDELTASAWTAWVAHLRGETDAAGDNFKRAEVLEIEIDSSVDYLYSIRGIQHAEHLRRIGDADYARRVTDANLEICKSQRWADNWSRSHRVLGDLDGDAGDHHSARQHYDTALGIARGIQYRPALIEGLLGRGRWAAALAEDLPTARSDLNEALGLCLQSGYRIYEAECRVGLAWLHFRDGAIDAARQQAEIAKSMSAEMGYHWGLVDADAILGML